MRLQEGGVEGVCVVKVIEVVFPEADDDDDDDDVLLGYITQVTQ